jgi:zinc protease
VLLATLDQIAKEPPSKEEVDRAKNRILKQVELNMANSQQIAVDLSEWASMADWRMLFIHRDRVKKVTPEDVARVAKAYMKPTNRTLGQFIPTEKPDRAEIPPIPDVTKEVSAYQGGAAIQEGEVFDTSYANIDARTQRAQLPGGLKLQLLPKKTRGGVVVAQMSTHFGDEKSLFGKSTTAGLTGAMLMRGTKTKTRQQIQDALDKMKARMNVGGSVDGASVSIQTTRENLPAVMRLAAEVLKEPGFPAEEFDKLKTQQIAQAESAKPEPQTRAINGLQKWFSPYPRGDVRYASSPDEAIEDLKKVDLAAIQQFHKDFYGSNHAELAVVGDFDAAEVKALAQELFGNWKSASPYKMVKREFKPIAPVNEKYETPDKTNAFFVAAMPVQMSDEHPDYPAMQLANYLLGGGTLSSRLGDRIRKKDGLSYGVQSIFQAPPQQDLAQFLSLAISNPQNSPKVEAAFKDEMEKLMKDGFTADEVDKAKAALLQERQVARSQDAQVAGTLATLDRFGRTMAFSAKIEDAIKNLTPEVVNAAVRKHIQLEKLAYFKAGDFAKAAAAPAAAAPAPPKQ